MLCCFRIGFAASSILARAPGARIVVRRIMAEVAAGGHRQICDDNDRATKKLKGNVSEEPAVFETALEDPPAVKEVNEEGAKEAGGNGGDSGSPMIGGDGKPLSKNAQKRLKKLEMLAQKKRDMKAREKEKKKERKEQKALEWAHLSPEEQEAAKQRCKDAGQARAEESKRRKEKLHKALEAGQNIVIDFQFCEQMTEQEIANMGQQIMYCYAANARAQVPCRMSLTSVFGRMKQQLEKIPGYENWMLHREETSFMDAFASRTQDLVYLTADSDKILESVDDSKIYVIGGLVDHNRMKCITLNKAKEQGIATARLPIQENIKLTTSTVLTVNQVLEILLQYLVSKDWAKALKSIIPQRKLAETQQ